MIKTITFTGADDFINPEDLLNISKQYPHVEWGILFPSYGTGRFPSKQWVNKLTATVQINTLTPVKLCAHFCEPWVEKILLTPLYFTELVNNIGNDIMSQFKRIQLNFHGNNFKHEIPNVIENLQLLIKNNPDFEFIVQDDGVNNFAVIPNISLLLDKSSGAGFFNNTWYSKNRIEELNKLNISFGYAGGLGIDSLPTAVDQWRKENLTLDWIDMETKVRDGQGFSLPKVIEILEYMQPYIYKEKHASTRN